MQDDLGRSSYASFYVISPSGEEQTVNRRLVQARSGNEGNYFSFDEDKLGGRKGKDVLVAGRLLDDEKPGSWIRFSTRDLPNRNDF